MKILEKTNLIPSPFKIGRPLFNGKNSEQVVSKLEYAFSIDCTVKEACIYAGISTSSYYRFLNVEPEYRDRFELLRHTLPIKVKQTIANEIFAGNLKMTWWYAERKMATEFNKDQVVKLEIERLRNENKRLRTKLQNCINSNNP